jgi:putative flippase GtrA
MTAEKLSSLTIFFPFFNDEKTVERQINDAFKVGGLVANNLEVVAIHGGHSKDNTLHEINRMAKKYPSLVVIDKSDNKEGYAVIKEGFKKASRDWVFYTDGDAQYHLDDLPKLVSRKFETNADVVNGFKIERGDNFIRTLLGKVYANLSSFIFELPIRDTDCDFRLIKKSYLEKINLVSKDASVLGELIKKLEIVGAKFAEVSVLHYPREYGVSNYTPLGLFKEKLIGDFTLYLKLKKMQKMGEHLRIVKFASVGISSILIQTLFFNAFIIFVNLSPPISAIISDQIAIASSFIFNNYLTFKDKKHRIRTAMLKGFLKFYAIVMVSTLFQSFAVMFGITVFGKSLIVANSFFAAGLLLSFFWNYKMQKRLVWK